MRTERLINKLMPRVALLLLGLIILSVSCTKAENGERGVSPSSSSVSVKPQGRAYFDLFDTVSYVYSYKGDSEEEFLENADEVYYTLLRYHRLFDIYHEYEGMNNLCTINSNPGVAIGVDDEIIEFLDYAQKMYSITGGRMDVMMGSVLSLWHDARYSDEPYLPSYEDLEDAARYTGFGYLEIDREKKTVKLLSDRASLDAGALGKGYATEKAAEILEEKGVESYVLNIGGNIRIIGSKTDGSGWRTGVRDPKNPDSAFVVVLSLKDTSCVTSGSYERYFTVDGVRYSHIIDPETLYSAGYFDSVTVVTKNSALADALSTALFCMPYKEGAELASSLSVDVVWVFKDGTVRYTDGIKALLIE